MNGVGRNQLRINAFELLRRPGTEKAIHLALEPSVIEVTDPRLPPGSTIDVDLECESLSDGIVVHGRIAARFLSECRRCLQPVAGSIESEIDELYQTVVTDPDAFPIDNDQIDLAPMVRETVLLDLPDGPLCRKECAGLCPTCGKDLNSGPCPCPKEAVDPRWSILDTLRDQLPE